jgi:hypothetical protein
VRAFTDAQWAVLKALAAAAPPIIDLRGLLVMMLLLAAARETWMLSWENWRHAPRASSCGRESFRAQAPTAAVMAFAAPEPL